MNAIFRFFFYFSA
ncbi:pheST operon leader peptide PheM [Erwinia aphidicola]|nr:pheST operon leader peptide PheM [Erwinia aphidicola]MBD1377524.1 pheST operon leader peptide PheM [Erwinia aphidicola]MBN1086085.1 pheST operon leader peptide PheM [Erwinia aphidicola]